MVWAGCPHVGSNESSPGLAKPCTGTFLPPWLCCVSWGWWQQAQEVLALGRVPGDTQWGWGMQPWGGCSGIPTAGSHTSPFLIFPQRDRPAPRFTQVSVLSRGCWLRVPPSPVSPPYSPHHHHHHPPRDVPVLGLQGTCWLWSSGCSLPSQHWPSCTTSTSSAARTHGEWWAEQGRGHRCPPPPYPCTLLYGKRALRRRVFGASLSALTPCSLSHARLDSPTKSKVIYTAATTENTA